MNDEMKDRLLGILYTILDLLQSKKFLAAISASFLAWQTTGDGWAAIAPLAAYIVAQGVADHGKEKAKVDGVMLMMEEEENG
jgi:hypothetical protein